MSEPLDTRRAIFLVTGIQAAGKSTISRLLARRFDRGAYIDGDVMWKLIVSGRDDMTANPSDEAFRQLQLRYKHGAMLARSFLDDGFTAVHCDIVVQSDLEKYVERMRGRPLHVVVLCPSSAAVVERERGRGTSAYRDWGPLEEAVETFQGWLALTPRIGLWLDTSDQTPETSVDEIMRRVWDEGTVT